MMRRYAIGSAAIALITMSAFAQVPNAERGRALYENHCRVCHTEKVHKRVHRIALTRREITELVERWQAQENLRWGKQEIDDVVEFLARTQYRL